MGALDVPAGTATTGTLLAVPRNDSLPVSDVPARDTGAGIVVVVVGFDVDPDVTLDDDPGRDVVPDGASFAEQALPASARATSTPNTARRETKLVRRLGSVASCRPRRARRRVTAPDVGCDEIGEARWVVSKGR
jgi:hypothetical protein